MEDSSYIFILNDKFGNWMPTSTILFNNLFI